MYSDKFYLGASYYPEWWSEDRWEKDFSMMEELGLNLVRMGEFAWSWYEPREGEFLFAVNMKSSPNFVDFADARCYDILAEKELSGKVQLEPYGVVFAKKL